MTTEMKPIQTQSEIFAELFVIQQANAIKIKGPRIDMRRHMKAQARSGILGHVHNPATQNKPRSHKKKKPKTRY
jgi:hypothetical protein